MSEQNGKRRPQGRLLAENQELRLRLVEAERALEAMKASEARLRATCVSSPGVANGEPTVQEQELRAANEALQESEQKYRTLFNSIDQGFCIIEMVFDAAGRPTDYRFLQTNRAFERQTGLHEAQGKLMRELAPDHEAHWFEIYGRIARTGQPERFVNEAKALGRWYDVYAFRVDEPQSRHVAILFNDITERRQAEETLRLSEEKFRNLHRLSPVAIVLNRLDNGQFLETNQAMSDMTGYTEEELRSLSYWDLTPGDYQEMEAKQLELLRTAGRYGPYEKEYIRKDGTRFPVLLSGVRITDSSGTDLIYSVIQDITEPRKKADALRESEERLKRAQEIAHLGSWELDLVNNRLSWSDEAYRIFGLQPQEFGASYTAFLAAVHPEDRAAVDAAYSGSLREGRDSYEIEHRIVRKSTGEVRIVHEKCRHVRDVSGHIIRSLGMVHDVTERRQAEDALRELTRTLETKVAERTAELQYRARQLQRLTLELSETEDRERRHLAEILHDDLQQQLAAAKFHLNLLSNRAKYDPAQQMMIGQIDRMIMDAIQKSRSLSHELSPAVLYQGGLAEALHWLVEQIRAKHGLEVALDVPGGLPLESDALKMFLYRTAQELLFNVVKHARVGQARLRLRRRGRCVCLSVSDRGRGFDAQGLRETAGFGLLSIRERIGLLGGRMKIHSAPGHGATFRVVVPDGQQEPLLPREEIDGVSLESALVAPVEGAAAVRPGERRLRVLLADDHEIVREGLASLLQEEAGIQVVGQAANGREAVDLADRLRPDVVVMDVAMPLINGDEATRQIKMHLPRTRIVALSMYQEANLVERMRRAGADSYVLKTAPAEELLAAIRGEQPADVL
jgi:PAS domain S-box-containing protein